MDSHITLLVSGIALCLGVSYWFLSARYPKPPGPRGWPIIGNLLDMPTGFEWLHWETFKEIYGPVSGTTVLGKDVVILNTLEACNEMLDKRSSVYSGRPIMPFAGGIVGWDQQLLLCTYGKHFRTMRKLAHNHLGTKVAASAYHHVQETEMNSIGAILLRMSHGYSTHIDGNDPIVNLVEVASQDFYQATKPGAWLVDILPWLKYVPSWMPGAGFKRTGAKYLKTNVDQTDLPYNFVLKEMNNNTALPSFTSNALRSGDMTAEEKYALKFIAAALYGGGLDTLTGASTVFILAMVLFPDVQLKAQQELEKVIGTSRLPTIRDQEHLPYIAALQKEVHRWRTTVPGGVPHAATEDDIFNGFYIRKGTIIINNLWCAFTQLMINLISTPPPLLRAIAHDPTHYRDPMAFNPERFLGGTPELDPTAFTFGFGRRRCPGIEVAESTLFIVMATLLAVFRFSPLKGDVGNADEARDEFISGAVSHPKPFRCNIEPRSSDALHLLQMLASELPERMPSTL
ncbi:O-methylsterigmatocystin oxidoreductase [Favolaschia claudopus]|uniref:O-methylsterigmatocystin oxidoreductase n=1 Tax=Favolaschia claudopus TaxID=2862362 RepID=A0AAV9ZKQ1_9AGAR